MGIGLGDEWYKGKMNKILNKVVTKHGNSLTPTEQENIVRKATNIYSFIITLSLAIFFIYLFTTLTYKTIGYERTTLLLLTIIMLRMRWN
jgi:hypothetical protein